MRVLILAGLLTAIGAVAYAAPAPTTMESGFTSKPSRQATVGAAAAPACALNVTEVVDARRAPETLGVVLGKAVKSPSDTVAWLRSIVSDLGPRGYAVTFADPAAPPTAVSAKVTLQTAWIADEMANKVASVVLVVEASGPGGVSLKRPYRGSVALVNWVNGSDELQGAVNRAFGKALDQIAVDLRSLCA